MDKRILFVLLILIGSLVVAISIGYSLGVAQIVGYVAWFTSVSTAVYAILAQPKQRTEPILRITPLLKSSIVTANVTFWVRTIDIWIENIGYSIAKEIEVRCRLDPDGSIPLEKNGFFKHPLLAPKEIVQYQAAKSADVMDNFLSQRLTIETSYLNEDNKKQKPIKSVYLVKELQEGLKEVKTS
jgi:hypothetical protein